MESISSHPAYFLFQRENAFPALPERRIKIGSQGFPVFGDSLRRCGKRPPGSFTGNTNETE